MSILPKENLLPDFWATPQAMNRSTYSRNDLIYMKGEQFTQLYTVLSGRVKIVEYAPDGREMILDILHRGQFFDLKAWCCQTESEHFAIAMDRETQIGSFSLSTIDRLQKVHPDLRESLLRQLSQKIQQQEQRLQAYAFLNSKERVVAFFLQMVKKRGQRVGVEWVIRESFTHLEIAQYTATARQTVSTVISHLRSKNLINYNRRYIVIRDLDALKKLLNDG